MQFPFTLSLVRRSTVVTLTFASTDSEPVDLEVMQKLMTAYLWLFTKIGLDVTPCLTVNDSNTGGSVTLAFTTKDSAKLGRRILAPLVKVIRTMATAPALICKS